ncbi:MAG: hypothetical protein R2709_12435 [Marmoricola sp.]
MVIVTLAAPAVSAAPTNLPANANLVVTTKTVAQKIKSQSSWSRTRACTAVNAK